VLRGTEAVSDSSRSSSRQKPCLPIRSALFCPRSIQETTSAKEIPHSRQVDFCVIEKKFLISEGRKRNFPQVVVFEHVVKAGGTHGGSHQDAWRLY
jgi:hypothetical protein